VKAFYLTIATAIVIGWLSLTFFVHAISPVKAHCYARSMAPPRHHLYNTTVLLAAFAKSARSSVAQQWASPNNPGWVHRGRWEPPPPHLLATGKASS